VAINRPRNVRGRFTLRLRDGAVSVAVPDTKTGSRAPRNGRGSHRPGYEISNVPGEKPGKHARGPVGGWLIHREKDTSTKRAQAAVRRTTRNSGHPLAGQSGEHVRGGLRLRSIRSSGRDAPMQDTVRRCRGRTVRRCAYVGQPHQMLPGVVRSDVSRKGDPTYNPGVTVQ